MTASLQPRRAPRGMAQDRLHPLQPQLRHRSPARRPAPGARARRQGPPRLRRATPAKSRRASITTRTAATGWTRRCGAGPTAASRRSTGTPRSARSPRRSSRSATNTAATRSSTTAAADRETTCPAHTRARPARARFGLCGERAVAGEDRRVLGRRPALRPPVLPHRARLRTRRSGGLRRQEPVAVARLPARAGGAARDREGPEAHAGRDRPAPHRDRRARRLPSPGETGHRRVRTRSVARRVDRGGSSSTRSSCASTPAARTKCSPRSATRRSRRTASGRESRKRRYAKSRAASGAPRASRCSKTSASSSRVTARSTRIWRSSSTCSPGTSPSPALRICTRSSASCSAEVAANGARRSAVTASSAD